MNKEENIKFLTYNKFFVTGDMSQEKYCTSEEQTKIKEMYCTGQYSYKQLGEKMALSKSTVINVVRDYPYSKTPGERYNKLQKESKIRLKAAIRQAETKAQEAYTNDKMVEFGKNLQRMTELLQILDDNNPLYEKLCVLRRVYEQHAWQALGDLDYIMFGYYAESWEIINDAINDYAKSPFRLLAQRENAKSKSKSIRFTCKNK